MTHSDRYRRLKNATELSDEQLAEVFGIDRETANDWYVGRREVPREFSGTLLRLEGDHLAELSPNLSPEALRAFQAGRDRARV